MTGSDQCYDSPPPEVRSAIEIAAELVRTAEGKNRALACDAAKKMMQQHEEIKWLKEHLSNISETVKNAFTR